MLVTQKYVSPLECEMCPLSFDCMYGKSGQELYNKGIAIKKENCKFYTELKSSKKIIYSKRRKEKWQ